MSDKDIKSGPQKININGTKFLCLKRGFSRGMKCSRNESYVSMCFFTHSKHVCGTHPIAQHG